MRVMIIGGGASGMMAALTASESRENRVLLIERQARVGRKLLATGNGRCNLSNLNLSAAHYHGQTPEFCRFALEEFGVERTLAFFHSLGLLTTAEEPVEILLPEFTALCCSVTYCMQIQPWSMRPQATPLTVVCS